MATFTCDVCGEKVVVSGSGLAAMMAAGAAQKENCRGPSATNPPKPPAAHAKVRKTKMALAEELSKAIRKGQNDTVLQMIRDRESLGLDINYQEGDTVRSSELSSSRVQVVNAPLYWAASRKNATATVALVEAGARVNCKNIFDHTPLYRAAMVGDDQLVSFLLGVGADPSLGLPAVRVAEEKGHSQCAQLLARFGFTRGDRGELGKKALVAANRVDLEQWFEAEVQRSAGTLLVSEEREEEAMRRLEVEQAMMNKGSCLPCA